MKDSIVVVMSAYNGSKYIEAQLNSIFNQEDVDVTCVVRNDGSKDNTLEILKQYKEHESRLIILDEKNVGWEQSFIQALEKAPDCEFFAFADQDDIWFPNKLKNAIEKIKKEDRHTAILFHCNKISVWESLEPLSKQVKRIPKALNRQNALIQEYAQGCSIVMNKTARALVLRNPPKGKIPHDFWCALVCYLFGKIIYDDTAYFYHISHGSNASGEGHTWKSRYARFLSYFKSKSVYHLPINELVNGYSDFLTEEDKKFIKHLSNYKKNILDKFILLCSLNFRRASILGTLSLKFSILSNKL